LLGAGAAIGTGPVLMMVNHSSVHRAVGPPGFELWVSVLGAALVGQNGALAGADRPPTGAARPMTAGFDGPARVLAPKTRAK